MVPGVREQAVEWVLPGLRQQLLHAPRLHHGRHGRPNLVYSYPLEMIMSLYSWPATGMPGSAACPVCCHHRGCSPACAPSSSSTCCSSVEAALWVQSMACGLPEAVPCWPQHPSIWPPRWSLRRRLFLSHTSVTERPLLTIPVYRVER